MELTELIRLQALAEGYAWGWKDSNPDLAAPMSDAFGLAYRERYRLWSAAPFGARGSMPAITSAWDEYRDTGRIG